jgi:hypothetical protein
MRDLRKEKNFLRKELKEKNVSLRFSPCGLIRLTFSNVHISTGQRCGLNSTLPSRRIHSFLFAFSIICFFLHQETSWKAFHLYLSLCPLNMHGGSLLHYP